jgi:hypothetical protein
VILEFPSPVELESLEVKFQGGFVGKNCQVQGGDGETELTTFFEFYPEDVNSLQVSFIYCTCRRDIIFFISFPDLQD